MSTTDPQTSGPPAPAGFTVPAPRRTDAIGAALRQAFEARRPLPGELAGTLTRLGER